VTRRVLTESGWVDGKAAPRLLPEPLRELPSDYVTNEIEDASRVHELDPAHILEALVDDRREAEQGKQPEAEQNLPRLPGPEHTRCTQDNIDLIRLRVLSVLVSQNAARVDGGQLPDLRVRHIWFPSDDVLGECLLRWGNPPPDRDRPRHLKHKSIEIDPSQMPASIVERIARDKTMREEYVKHIQCASERESRIVDAQGQHMRLP
jgi:hypothetical protein